MMICVASEVFIYTAYMFFINCLRLKQFVIFEADGVRY